MNNGIKPGLNLNQVPILFYFGRGDSRTESFTNPKLNHSKNCTKDFSQEKPNKKIISKLRTCIGNNLELCIVLTSFPLTT
jgi:hypothetical protein